MSSLVWNSTRVRCTMYRLTALPAMTTTAAPMTPCPNCGAALDGSFCAQCGQKVAPLNPPLRESLHEFVHELLDLDGKIFGSVRLLLTRPGLLSLEQVEGRRVRHVSPIRLYLIFSVVYFAVAAFAPTAAFNVNITFIPDADDTPQEIAEAESRLPEIRRTAIQNMMRWLPRAMFVLVPLFAAVIALVNRKSGRNYPLHLYFALHVQAAWFFAAAASAASRIKDIPVVTTVVPVFALVYGAAYIVLAFRKAYGVSVPGALLRAVTVTSVYLVLVLAAVFATIAPVVFAR